MRKTLALLAVAATGMIGACAADDGPRHAGDNPRDARMCFLPRDLRNWKKQDDFTVLLRARRDEIFRAHLLTPCFDLDFSTRLAIVARPGPWICDGDDATLVTVRVDHPEERCDISEIHGLTKEEAAALGPKVLP